MLPKDPLLIGKIRARAGHVRLLQQHRRRWPDHQPEFLRRHLPRQRRRQRHAHGHREQLRGDVPRPHVARAPLHGEPRAPRQHDPTERDHVQLRNSVANDGKSLLANWAIGGNVVRRIDITLIDLIFWNKSVNINSPRALDLYGLGCGRAYLRDEIRAEC
jgi:hypothetical protein